MLKNSHKKEVITEVISFVILPSIMVSIFMFAAGCMMWNVGGHERVPLWICIYLPTLIWSTLTYGLAKEKWWAVKEVWQLIQKRLSRSPSRNCI